MSLVEEKRDRLSSQIGDGITLKDHAEEGEAGGNGWSSLKRRRHGRPYSGAAESEILRDPWVLSRIHIILDVSQVTDVLYSDLCRSGQFLIEQMVYQTIRKVGYLGTKGRRRWRSVANETSSRAGVTGRAAARSHADARRHSTTVRTQSIQRTPSRETSMSVSSFSCRL